MNGARFLGFTYLGRDDLDNNVFVVGMSKENETRTYELLNAIEFNSTRKRMTSVFRDTSTGEIVVMCKGADSVLLPLLKD